MATWDKALSTLTHVEEYLDADGVQMQAVLAGMQALPAVSNQELMACVNLPIPERRLDGCASIVGKDVAAAVGLRVRLLPPIASQGIGTVVSVAEEGCCTVTWCVLALPPCLPGYLPPGLPASRPPSLFLLPRSLSACVCIFCRSAHTSPVSFESCRQDIDRWARPAPCCARALRCPLYRDNGAVHSCRAGLFEEYWLAVHFDSP